MSYCDIDTHVQHINHIDRLTRENAELRDQLQILFNAVTRLLDAVTYPFSDEPESNVTANRNLDNAIEASQALLESI